uniref:Putative secreted protein n=1 Tax=Anopheles darlingi TaxID=43151 RepID=A0A2M4D6J0_ANODA
MMNIKFFARVFLFSTECRCFENIYARYATSVTIYVWLRGYTGLERLESAPRTKQEKPLHSGEHTQSISHINRLCVRVRACVCVCVC